MPRKEDTTRYEVPVRCIEAHPTAQSIYFCGQFISLSLIAFHTNLPISLLSYIFSGKRAPTLKSATLVADALGMTVDRLLYHLKYRQKLAQTYLKKTG